MGGGVVGRLPSLGCDAARMASFDDLVGPFNLFPASRGSELKSHVSIDSLKSTKEGNDNKSWGAQIGDNEGD